MLIEPGVAVQPAHHNIDDEQVEQHRDEAGDVDPGGLGFAPAGGGAGVEVGGVDDPGDEGDRLLRVPAPEAAPGRFGPDRAQDDAGAEDREADDGGAVG